MRIVAYLFARFFFCNDIIEIINPAVKVVSKLFPKNLHEGEN